MRPGKSGHDSGTGEVRGGAKGCNRLIATLDSPPPPYPEHSAWKDRTRGTWVESCHKHGGVSTTLEDVQRRRETKGQPDIDWSKLMRFIPWSELRDPFGRSERTGRATTMIVEPLNRRI